MIAHGVRNGKVVVARRRHIAILDERVVQMPIEAVLHFAHVLHLHDAAHADLLALVDVGLGCRHDATHTVVLCCGAIRVELRYK